MVFPTYGGNTYDYVNYNRFLLTSAGGVYGVKQVVHEDYDNSANSSTRSYLVRWDLSGKLMEEKELEGLIQNSEEAYSYVNSLLEGKDGSVYVLVGGDTYFLVKVGADGSVSDRREFPDSARQMFDYNDKVIPMEPGQVYVVYRDENEWEKMYGSTYDLETGAVGEKQDLPSEIRYGWDYNVMTGGVSGELLYSTNEGICSYKPGDAGIKAKMNYVNSDLYLSQIYALTPLSEESFLGVYGEEWGGELKAGLFTYVRPEDIVDKKTMVMAGIYISDDVKRRVIEYNRNNQEYRIVLKSYQEYNSEENEYTGAVTQLNNDIISGKMPDILIEETNLPMENYISKGLIADVGKLIEEDEELSQVEFLQNVFDAYSVGGTLYYVVPDFYVNTLVAKESLVGGRDSWTMDDMNQVLAGMGENAVAFGETTRNDYMNAVMNYCGDSFVDLATGKCRFNTEDFIKMMEYAKTLPKEFNRDGEDDTYWEDYWNNYQSQYRENRTLLMPCYMSNFRWMVENIKGYFGDDFTFAGFPTENGGRSFLMCNRAYVLSAKSSNLDEAWNFVKYYLGEEYQKDLGFPVRKDFFLENAKMLMERPYWEDENGNKEYYDYTTYINGESVVLEPFTEEQVKKVTDFIQSVDHRYSYDREIMKIIEEETEAFFSGQKTAEEVADIIQRRAQMYVDTNR